MRTHRLSIFAILAFILVLMVPGFVAAMPQDVATVDESVNGLAWVTPQIKGPRVSFHTFDSAAAKTKVSYHLYTPAAYDDDRAERLPVVYWLHGSGGGLPGIP
ncbi:MAG: hypothetical protein RI963_3547, partial [Planctomycetota bacterium]